MIQPNIQLQRVIDLTTPELKQILGEQVAQIVKEQLAAAKTDEKILNIKQAEIFLNVSYTTFNRIRNTFENGLSIMPCDGGEENSSPVWKTSTLLKGYIKYNGNKKKKGE